MWFLRWTLEHTIREVFPWYWGVFNWLGVVLPRWTNRIILRFIGLAVIGIVILLYRRIQSGFFKQYDKALFLFGLSSAAYFLGVFAWDFVFFSKYHYSFGIQGRYFFPTIIPHMTFIVWGVRGFVFERWIRLWPIILFFLVVGMVALNSHALGVVLASYYSFDSWETFFNQASQYKPFFFKSPFLLGWIGVYVFVILAVIRRLYLCLPQRIEE